MEDVYYTNDRKIYLKEEEEEVLHSFCIAEYESLDFLAVVTTSDLNHHDHNDLRLNLYQDNRKVSTSIDDGDHGGDDNSSLALHYKTKAGRNTTCF